MNEVYEGQWSYLGILPDDERKTAVRNEVESAAKSIAWMKRLSGEDGRYAAELVEARTKLRHVVGYFLRDYPELEGQDLSVDVTDLFPGRREPVKPVIVHLRPNEADPATLCVVVE